MTSQGKTLFLNLLEVPATTGLCVRSDRKENRIFNEARGVNMKTKRGIKANGDKHKNRTEIKDQ